MAYDDPNDDDEDKLLSSYLDSYATDARPQLDYAPAPDAAPSTIAPEEMAAATDYGDSLQGRRDSAYNQYLQSAASPTESSPDVGGKIGQFLGDNAVGILGTLLDAGFNKGRGIPQILTQNAAAQNQAIDQRRADEDRSLAFQLQAQKQRADAAKGMDAAERDEAYKKALQLHWQKQEDAAMRNADTRDRSFTLREQESKILNDPDDPAVVALKEQFYQTGTPRGSLAKMNLLTIRQDRTLGPRVDTWMREHNLGLVGREAYTRGAQGEAGRSAVEIANAPVMTGIAADRARATTTATGEATAAQAKATTAEAGANKVLPGAVVKDPLAYQQNAAIPGTFAKMQTDVGGFKTALDSLRTMAALEQKYGTALSGEAKTMYDMAQVLVNTGLTQAGSTGTLTDSERAYYMSMIPSFDPGIKDLAKLGGRNIRREQLSGALKAFENVANSKLHVYGIGMEGPEQAGGAPQPRAARPAAPPPARKPAPAAPAAPPAGAFTGSRAVKNPDGTYQVLDAQGVVKRKALPASALQLFISGGGKVQ